MSDKANLDQKLQTELGNNSLIEPLAQDSKLKVDPQEEEEKNVNLEGTSCNFKEGIEPVETKETNQEQAQEQKQGQAKDGKEGGKKEGEKFDDLSMLQYEVEVKELESKKTPLVSKTELLSNLCKEYEQGNPVYIVKINELSKRYKFLRRCRGDGNCFYRAFAFSLFEKMMLSTQEVYHTILHKVTTSFQLLLSIGYERIAIEDFYETFHTALLTFEPPVVRSKDSDVELTVRLKSLFSHDESANAIIMYLRLVTSAYLKLEQDQYLPFLLDSPVMYNVPYHLEPIDHFRQTEVEVMGKESDEIHIILVAKYFQLHLQVAYLDSHGDDEKVNFHKYSDHEVSSNLFLNSPITLLYRPGHYDILYPGN